jgi:hypothetical protein
MDWYHFKQSLELSLGLHMDALHVYAGVIVQLVAALLLQRSVANSLPWLIVLITVVANEYYDLAYEVWPQRDMQYAEGLKDAWNTMLMPTVLMLLARFAPRLFHRSGNEAVDPAGPDVVEGH